MKPKLSQKVGRALKKASPTILTCIGAVGVVATAVLAVKATPKALEMVRADSRKNHDGDPHAATKVEVVKSCWKCYIPAAVTGAATIACIFGANTLNRRQQASLASAYALVNRSFMEYKNKVKELYGQETHDRIMDSLMVEKTEAPSISGSLTGRRFDFGETDDQKHLFYDAFSKRYFEATFSDVLLAELHVNRNFAINGGEIGVSEFYKFLGLDTPEDIADLSWFVSDYYYFIDFSHSKHRIDDGPDREPIECWMESVLNWSMVISVIGVLVVVTNIVVQVLKKVTWDKLPTNILAVAVSMVLTLVAFFAYCQIKAIAVVWYMVAAAVVLGFMVAYAAMFGYDKLMEAIGRTGKQ